MKNDNYWLFKITYQGKLYIKSFRNKKYGSKEKAMHAALKCMNNFKETHKNNNYQHLQNSIDADLDSVDI